MSDDLRTTLIWGLIVVGGAAVLIFCISYGIRSGLKHRERDVRAAPDDPRMAKPGRSRAKSMNFPDD